MFQVQEPLSADMLEALNLENAAMKCGNILISVQSDNVAYCRLDGRSNRLRIGLRPNFLSVDRVTILLKDKSTNRLELSVNVPNDAAWYFPIVKVRVGLSDSDCELVVQLRTKEERQLFVGKLNHNRLLKK